MKTVEAQGYSKQKAFDTTDLNLEFEVLKNATTSWKKAGSPMGGKDINAFMAGYLKDKRAVGAYLVIEPSSDDTRKRPYKVINEVTTGKRKRKTFYQIKEADLKVKTKTNVDEEGVEKITYDVKVENIGAVEGRGEKKEDAVRLMKDLIEETNKNYVIEIVSEVVEGQKYASYGLYTPSKAAKLGKFVFFTRD